MKKILLLLLLVGAFGCGTKVEKYGNDSAEVVYSSGATNLAIVLRKVRVDSVVYIIASRREGIAIIKHGTIR